MIDSIGSTLVWCVVQVSLVALAGIVLSLLIARRNTFAAGSIVSVAAVVSAVLTLVAPLPIHRWFMLETQPSLAVTEATRNILPVRPGMGAANDESPGVSPPVPLISLQALSASLRSMVSQVESFEQHDRAAVQGTIWTLLAVIGVGLARLGVGLAFVVRLRRGGIPITDPMLLARLEELSASLHCRTVPEIREIPGFADAAVAGWLRPTLILPRGWQQWTADEQRAVLAHELVHIVRRDSLWRALASSLLAIHFYNPVLHWLLRRIVLHQELAADVLAAEVVGQRSYLRSLSSLAIRRDDHLGRSASPHVLPVFSGQLIKRIKMLHSKDGRTETSNRRRRNLTSAMISMVFLALGIAAVATRGIAQPPSGEPKSATGSVKRISFTNVVPENKPGVDPTQEMFRRSPLDPAILKENNRHGVVAIRPRELLQHADLQGYVPVLNGLLSTWMASELKSKTPPSVAVESIEWIAAVPNASFKAATKETKSQAQFGATNPVIKLSQPLDLKHWVERFAPEAKRNVVEGRDVFGMNFASLGPIVCCIWMKDPTTIYVNLQHQEITAETKLADLMPIPHPSASLGGTKAKSTPASASMPWAAVWSRIDCGVGSFVLADADLSGLLTDLDDKPSLQTESMQAIGRAYKSLMSRCTMTAFSCDMPAGKSQFGVRLSLIHPSREAATQSAQDVREMLTLTKGEFTKHLNTSEATGEVDEIDQGVIRLYDAALQVATVSVDEYDDGTAAVVIATALPFDKVVELAIQVINDSPAP